MNDTRAMLVHIVNGKLVMMPSCTGAVKWCIESVAGPSTHDMYELLSVPPGGAPMVLISSHANIVHAIEAGWALG